MSAATMARRTVILITHRPASLALADRVLRLDAGVISENIHSPLHPIKAITFFKANSRS